MRRALAPVTDPLQRRLQALLSLPVGPQGSDLPAWRAWCDRLRAVAEELEAAGDRAPSLRPRLVAPPGGRPFPTRDAALRAARRAEPLPPPDPQELAAAWLLVADAEARGDDVGREQALRRVLLVSPNDPEAHRELAAGYRAWSEAAGAPDDARWRELCGWHDVGEHTAWLRGDAALVLRSDPPANCVAVGPDGERELGSTPLVAEGLPPGTWSLRLDAADRTTTALVELGRGERVELDVRLPVRVPAGFVHVAAGPFRCGGDDQADYPLPASVRTLAGFCIAEFPVTLGEYVAFLNARYADDPDDALLRVPRRPVGDGHRALLPTRRGAPQPFVAPPGGLDRQPVVGVSHDDVQAYIGWRSERDAVAYRLPTEIEWEKAARGVDGRAWPWGDAFDPARCNMRHTAERPSVLPVGAIAGDVSPYGMRDAAGNVLEWCAAGDDPVPAGGVPIRGGSWHSSPQACRVADRFGVGPHYVDPSLGFRLATDEG